MPAEISQSWRTEKVECRWLPTRRTYYCTPSSSHHYRCEMAAVWWGLDAKTTWWGLGKDYGFSGVCLKTSIHPVSPLSADFDTLRLRYLNNKRAYHLYSRLYWASCTDDQICRCFCGLAYNSPATVLVLAPNKVVQVTWSHLPHGNDVHRSENNTFRCNK